jgi:hypothetical protein
MELDLDPDVVAIAEQPFRLHFGGGRSHVPDILVTRADGDRRVIDVTTAERLEADEELRAVLERTRRACAAAEVGYDVVRDVDFDREYAQNLQWFAGFRRPIPDAEPVAKQLLSTCTASRSIGDVLASVDAGEEAARPVLFHLVATGVLAVDMHAPLTNDSLVFRR